MKKTNKKIIKAIVGFFLLSFAFVSAAEISCQKSSEVLGADGSICETHTLVLVNGKEETCLADGYKSCYRCSICGTYYTGIECTPTQLIGGDIEYEYWKLSFGKIDKHTDKLNYVAGVDPTCLDNGYRYYFECPVCLKDFENSNGTGYIEDLNYWKTLGKGKIEKLGHDFTTNAVYTWTGDTCTATAICSHPGCDKSVSETVKGVYRKDHIATCTVNEKGHYEARFTKEYFKTQETPTDSVEIPGTATGHLFIGTPIYSWNGDVCTGKIKCEYCDEFYVATEKGEFIEDTPATCLGNAKGHYVANFTDPKFSQSFSKANTAEKPNSALGHHFSGEVTYVFDEEGCTASWCCDRDGCDAIQTETVSYTFVADREATCSTDEIGHYEAIFTVPGFETQVLKPYSVINEGTALGHHFSGDISYVWTGNKCVASWHCDRVGCTSIESETAFGVYVKDTDATCTADEVGHYEVTFKNPSFEKQNSEQFSIPGTKTDHNLSIIYNWSEDLSECEAVQSCSGCDYKVNEKVKTTIDEENKLIVAKFTNPIFETQTKPLEVKKEGLSIWVIVGISAGGAVGLGLITAVIIVVVKNKKKRKVMVK